MSEQKLYLMGAVFGLQDYAAGAPGGINSVSGRAIILASRMLQATADVLAASEGEANDEGDAGVLPVRSETDCASEGQSREDEAGV
jgi:hypothetical protein